MANSKTARHVKLGIVTTVADAAHHIDFFIRYHLHIGIHHIIVFIDDRCEETLAIASNYSQVTPLMVDEAVAEAWTVVPAYRNRDKRSLRFKEVMVRQEFNAYLGFILAKKVGVDWLLHIDIDELFYTNSINIDEYFTHLESKNIGGCVFRNYEAIPVKSHSDSIYSSTTYFKKNFFNRGFWFFNEDQRKFIESVPWLTKFYFNYYQNGKAAANIHYELMIKDVHAMWGKGTRMDISKDDSPIILHFASATLAEFRRKYQRLGHFGDLWKGMPRAGKFIDTFHLQARDIHLQDESQMESLYRQRLLLNEDRLGELIHHNLAIEIKDVTTLYEQCTLSLGLSTRGSSLSLGHLSDLPKSEYSQYIETVRICLATASSDDRLPKLQFDSLGDARLWLRTHPQISNTKGYTIEAAKNKYVIAYAFQPLIDWSEDGAYTLMREKLYTLLSAGKAVALDLTKSLLRRSTTRYAFDERLEDLAVAQALAKSIDSSLDGGIYASVLPDIIPHLLINPTPKLADTRLADALIEIRERNNSRQFAEYVEGSLLREQDSKRAFDLSALEHIPPMYHRAIIGIICALGGSILYPSFLQSRCSTFNKFCSILKSQGFSNNSIPSVISHEEGLIIIRRKREVGAGELLAIANLTSRTVYPNEQFRTSWKWPHDWCLVSDVSDSLVDPDSLRPGQIFWLTSRLVT